MKIVLTGAAGDVGGRITPLLKAVYPGLVLSDVRPMTNTHGLPFVPADVRKPDEVARLLAGAYGVIHLGGVSIEGDWTSVRDINIDGCYNVFEEGRKAGVQRVIFASSNHAVGFYPRSETIPADVTVLPDSRYGLSKAFGEALGALYALKHGMRVTSLRIGNVNEQPLDVRRLSIMLHPEDLVQLIRIGLEHPGIVNEIFYGCSGNSRAWWDNSRAATFGYVPKHNAEQFRAHAEVEQKKAKPDPVGDFYQGGTFCAAEYSAQHLVEDAGRKPKT